MIAAIVLNIVIHAQMTVPWIGGFKSAGAPVSQASSVIVLTAADDLIVLQPDQVLVLQ